MLVRASFFLTFILHHVAIGFLAFFLIVLFLDPPRFIGAWGKSEYQTKKSDNRFRGNVSPHYRFYLVLASQWGGTTYPWSNIKVWGCMVGVVLQIALFGYLQAWFQGRDVHLHHQITDQFSNSLYQGAGNDAPSSSAKFDGTILSLISALYLYCHCNSDIVSTVSLPIRSRSLCNVVGGSHLTLYNDTTLFTNRQRSFHNRVRTLYAGDVYWCHSCCCGFCIDHHPRHKKQSISICWLSRSGGTRCRCSTNAFTAVPLALPRPDVSTATALVYFCNSLGPVIALTIGNILFANELSHELAGISGLSGKITGSSISGLVDFGASVPAQLLECIRVALAVALSRAFVLAIPTAGLAVCFAFGIQFLSWRSHWKSSRDRSENLIEQGLHPNGQS